MTEGHPNPIWEVFARQRQGGQSAERRGSGKVPETEYNGAVTIALQLRVSVCMDGWGQECITGGGPGEVSSEWILGGLEHGLEGSGSRKDTEAEGWQRQIFALHGPLWQPCRGKKDCWLRARVGGYTPEMKAV